MITRSETTKTNHSSKAFGLRGAELRELLQSDISDELGHATYLMDVIVDLGGEPTTEPQPFDKHDDLREMLEQDLEMEIEAVHNYTRRAEQAEAAGEMELKVTLENTIVDEAGHARELRRILKGL